MADEVSALEAAGAAAMKVIALCYHDVVENGEYSSSGFEGAHSDIYKLDSAEFSRHLSGMREPARAGSVLLTFDDGGVSGLRTTAPMLESAGVRGYFFITTNYIGRPGFLTRDDIRELHQRGHIVGSHSCSHPLRMSLCSDDELRDEWTRSIDTLSDILGERVRVASVPGGYYSERVAESAIEAGVTRLFNSEPVAGIQKMGPCEIIGRYSIQQATGAEVAAAIAAGALAPRAKQYVLWNAKKAIKRVGGSYWLAFRRAWFNRQSR